MKILFLTPWYPSAANPNYGVFVRELARAAQLHHDVAVLHLSGSYGSRLRRLWEVERELDNSITGGIPTWRLRYGPFLRRAAVPARIWSWLRVVDRIAGEGFNPDILHAHVFRAGFPAVIIGQSRGVPVVITEHASAFPRRKLTWSQVWRARIAFGRADYVLPVSNALRRVIEDYRLPGRFEVVPNVVDTRLFRPSGSPRGERDPLRLIFVGNLNGTPLKGVNILFQALSRMRISGKRWRLDLVGGGPALRDFQALAADFGLGNRVIFHNRQPKPRVAELMRAADLFVLPSIHETFSVATVEAMACGLPVVATRSGGPEEYLRPEHGILVPPGDAVALAEGLRAALDRLESFDSGAIARSSVARFGPQAVGSRLADIYAAALQRPGRLGR